MLGILREKISYFFFKQRLKKKMASLYEMEDPWRSSELCARFEPFLRSALQLRAKTVIAAPVLDAGGGEGWLQSHLGAEDYHLLDLAPKALERAKKRIGKNRVRIFCSSLDQFHPEANVYGAVFLISVLNYLGKDRHPRIYKIIVGELSSAVKPGGVIALIHPFYTPEEKSKLLSLSEDFLSNGSLEKRQSVVLPGKPQSFLCEMYQKRVN